MNEPLKLTESLEDYLEAIYHLESEYSVVRSKDIAARLGVNSPSVTGALRSLAEKKLVNYTPYEFISLTKKGRQIAVDIAHRHRILKDFFVKVLRVDDQESDKAACKMEHTIPKTILERLIKFIEFIDICPMAGTRWIDGFGYFCERGDQANCEQCIRELAQWTDESNEKLD